MSQSSQGSSSHPRATCTVCGTLIKIIPSTGTLWKHGHGHGREPCEGSYQHPLITSSGQSISSQAAPCTFPHDSLASTSSTDHPVGFSIPQPVRPVIARIPKGARPRASSALEQRLRAVVATPDSLICWTELFGFANLLGQPERGEKGHHLTT